MKLSIALSQRLDRNTVLYAQKAEQLGFDGVYVFDHLVPPAGEGAIALEAALGAIAASVARVKVGTMVLNTSLRPLEVTEAIARTLAAIAPGRGVIGLGMGDSVSRDAMERFGFGYLPKQERAERLEASLDVVGGTGVAVAVGGKGALVSALANSAALWNLWEPTPEELAAAVALHPSVSVSIRARGPFDRGFVDSLREYVLAGCVELVLAVLPATDPEALSNLARSLHD